MHLVETDNVHNLFLPDLKYIWDISQHWTAVFCNYNYKTRGLRKGRLYTCSEEKVWPAMVNHDDKTLREGVKKPSRETLSVQGKVSVAGVFDTFPNCKKLQ